MGKAKYKRCNIDRRSRCRALISFWYERAAKENGVTYGKTGERRVVEIPDEKVSKRQPFSAIGSNPRWWTRPENLTADGRETRDPHDFGSHRGGGSYTPINQGGRRYWELEPRTQYAELAYAREVLRHIARVCIDGRRALEMDVAGWTFAAMAEEIGCGENQARTLVDEALAHGVSYMELVKPSWGYGEEDLDDGLPSDGCGSS